MNFRKASFVCLMLFLGVGVLVAIRPNALTLKSAQYIAGQQDAQEDIRLGNPGFARIGLPVFSYGSIDRKTGLPWRGLGCMLDDETLDYLEGYNGEIMKSFKAGELEGMTYKSQVMTQQAAESLLTQQTFPLVPGGPGVLLPDGKFRLLLVAVPNGQPQFSFNDLILESTPDSKRQSIGHIYDKAQVAFTHKGRTFLVAGENALKTFDTATGRFLQGFVR